MGWHSTNRTTTMHVGSTTPPKPTNHMQQNKDSKTVEFSLYDTAGGWLNGQMDSWIVLVSWLVSKWWFVVPIFLNKLYASFIGNKWLKQLIKCDQGKRNNISKHDINENVCKHTLRSRRNALRCDVKRCIASMFTLATCNFRFL